MIHAIKEDTSLEIIVLKPGPARPGWSTQDPADLGLGPGRV
jgi:hypothetical protein